MQRYVFFRIFAKKFIMKKPFILEICADNIESCLIAQSAGAARVELCTNLAEGGTTPSYGLIEEAQWMLKETKLHVLIRPRGGDFFYNKREFEIMGSDVSRCEEFRCDGVVFGILNSDGTVDMERNRELVEFAKAWGMEATFHRAFDHCVDMFQSLEDVISLGFDRILTSGGKRTALEGAETIAQLIKQANDRIIIMPGAGITPENFAEIIEKTGATELHGTFRSLKQSEMQYKKPEFIDEYDYWLADTGKIKEVCKTTTT